MIDHSQEHEHVAHPHYQQAVQQVKDHKFITMIILSIIVSLFLVFAAMALYRSSGAALLDISRPGDEDVRSKVLKTDDSISFSASGTLDKTAFDEFEKKYDKVLNQIQRQTVFSSDPLSAKSLRIDQDSALQQGQTQAE